MLFGMVYDNVFACDRSDVPIDVSGIEVQLNGLCQDGGGFGDALGALLLLRLIPRSSSKVVVVLFAVLCKLV